MCPTFIEILTFNKWSLKFTVSRSVLSYIQSMELTDVSIDELSHWQNKNKMVLSTEDLVLIKVLRQQKGYDN